MRWVAEGHSSRFTLSTADGLNNLLAAMISFRDPLLKEGGDSAAGEDEHGSAFERISAFQFGFTDGASSCASIDPAEIKQRRGDLPVLLPEDQSGELQITEASVRSIVDAMGILFAPKNPPPADLRPARVCRCPFRRGRDLLSGEQHHLGGSAALEAMGAQSEAEPGTGLTTGDNTAYSVLVSRYMQAIQHERGGLALDSAKAALRTACLTGVATVKMTHAVNTPPDGNTIQLTAGDVDEAISGILSNGLVASDVNGGVRTVGLLAYRRLPGRCAGR